MKPSLRLARAILPALLLLFWGAAGVQAQTSYVSDTFTPLGTPDVAGANLTNHTANVGGKWVSGGTYGSTLVMGTADVYAGATTTGTAFLPATAPSRTVTADWDVLPKSVSGASVDTIGVIIHAVGTGSATGYMFRVLGNGNIDFWRNLSALSTTAYTLTAGTNIHFHEVITTSGATNTVFLYANNGTASYNAGTATTIVNGYSDTSGLAAGTVGTWSDGTATATTGLHLSALVVTSPSTGLTAGTITASATTASSITPQESGITGGTAPYSTVFSYSTATNGTYTQIGTAVAGASPVASTAATGLTASTTYYFRAVTTDSAGTPAVITAPSASTGTPLATSAAASVTIAFGAAGIYYSPYSWASGMTNCTGAYMVVPLTTTAAGAVTLNLDTTSISSPAPTLVWNVDGGPYQPQVSAGAVLTQGLQMSAGNLTGTAPTQSVTLFPNLAAGTHTLRVWVRSEQSTATGIWAGGVIKVTGLTAPSGATLGTYTPSALNAVFFGDSITEGEGSDGYAAANYPLSNDALDNWTWDLAHALGVEYGNVGSGGQSYAGTGANGFPAFNTSWSQINSTVSRLSAGKFSPVPDWVFVNQGTNAAPSAADVSAMMTNLRGASNAATKIVFVVPFGQQAQSAILSGLTTYGGSYTTVNGPSGGRIFAATSDTNTWVIDLGTAASLGLTSNVGPPGTEQSYEGIHPSAQASAKLASLLTQAIQAKLGGATTTIKRRIN